MKHLFKVAYLTAARLVGGTDFLITVNPRHTRFYRRTLLMEPQGPERSYDKVAGAPAVLLGLDLTTAEDRFCGHYGDRAGSFFRFFVDPATETGILRWVARHHRPLARPALREYFMMKKPLLQSLPRPLRHYLEECYPGYDLRLVKPRTPDTEPVRNARSSGPDTSASRLEPVDLVA
jgi:hypothetical protein